MSTGFSAAAVTSSASGPAGGSISSARGVPPISCSRAARTVVSLRLARRSRRWRLVQPPRRVGISVLELSEERFEIERGERHLELAALRPRPLLLQPVAVELDAVVVVVAQVDGLAHPVVAGALERNP